MNVTYSEKAKRALGETGVARTNAFTTKALAEYPFLPLTVIWDVSEDEKGEPRYTILANDPEETARETLEPDEVQSDHHLRFHLYMLTGSLFRQHSNKVIRYPLKTEAANGQKD